MTDTPSNPLNESAVARQERLRQALRDNLKRRKSQSRGRAGIAGADAMADTSGAADQEDICSRPAGPDQD